MLVAGAPSGSRQSHLHSRHFCPFLTNSSSSTIWFLCHRHAEDVRHLSTQRSCLKTALRAAIGNVDTNWTNSQFFFSMRATQDCDSDLLGHAAPILHCMSHRAVPRMETSDSPVAAESYHTVLSRVFPDVFERDGRNERQYHHNGQRNLHHSHLRPNMHPRTET